MRGFLTMTFRGIKNLTGLALMTMIITVAIFADAPAAVVEQQQDPPKNNPPKIVVPPKNERPPNPPPRNSGETKPKKP